MPVLLSLVVGGGVLGASDRSPITSLRELRGLTAAEAARSLPVVVRGTITYFEPERSLAFIQSEDGAAYFAPDAATVLSRSEARSVFGSDRFRPGDYVEVRGVSMPGGFAPAISSGSEGKMTVEFLWRRSIPTALRLHPRVFLDPTLDSYWVEAAGVVRSVGLEQDRLSLVFADGSRDYRVFFPGTYAEDAIPDDWVGSRVRVAAVYGSVTNRDRELVGVQFFSPSLDWVTVLERGAEDVFALPPLNVNDLFRYRVDSVERVHVRGVVTAAFPPDALYLRVNDRPLRVEVEQEVLPPVGTVVSVAAYPELERDGVYLHTATLRLSDETLPTPPVSMAATGNRDRLESGELIRVEGRLVDTLSDARQRLLVLENGAEQFTAFLPMGRGEVAEEFVQGSWLELTGIYKSGLETVNPAVKPALGFTLLLRTGGDIRVLRTAPFWTMARVLGAAGVVFAGFVAAALWSFLLQRKVRQQAALLARKTEMEKIQEERDRIARELHDTLEQDLAAVSIQLNLVEDTFGRDPSTAQQSLAAAKGLLRRTQMESRHAIQDLRDDLLARQQFGDALMTMVQRFRMAHATPIEVAVESDLSGLSPDRQHHLLLLLREALYNAVTHAGATLVEIRVFREGDSDILTVNDDGKGFDVTARHPGHFGLVGMQERARMIGAELGIDSRPGSGTLVRLRLPRGNPAPTQKDISLTSKTP